VAFFKFRFVTPDFDQIRSTEIMTSTTEFIYKIERKKSSKSVPVGYFLWKYRSSSLTSWFEFRKVMRDLYRILGVKSLASCLILPITDSKPPRRPLSDLSRLAISGSLHCCPCVARYRRLRTHPQLGSPKSWTRKSHDPAEFKIQPWRHGKAAGALASRQPRRPFFSSPELYPGGR
jgi:hypothetical protein